MSQDPAENAPDVSPLPHPRRIRQSPWPLVAAVAVLAVVLVGTVLTLLRRRTGDEPWRIDYPGVTWVLGEDSSTVEGKRYLQAEVRFEQDVVSAQDLKLFLAALVDHSKGTYQYYHIKVLNRRGVHVLDGVADRTGLHSISVTDAYSDQ